LATKHPLNERKNSACRNLFFKLIGFDADAK